MAHENSNLNSVQKPAQVRIAILLLYAYSVINFLVNLILTAINGNFSIGLAIYQTIIFIISIFFVFTISKGKTWPRNLMLLFFILGITGGLFELTSIKDEFKYLFIVSLTPYFLGLIPVILLYLKPAKQWFGTFK